MIPTLCVSFSWNSFTIEIVIIVSILVLGIISIFHDVYSSNQKINKIQDFANNFHKLTEKVSKKQKTDNEERKFLSDKDEISQIMYEFNFPAPISETSILLSGIGRSQYLIKKQYSLFANDAIEKIAKIEKSSRTSFRKSISNPFIWLYKGIECVLWYMFGYLIHKINPHFTIHNGIWKTIVTIISFVGTIMTILCFFGYDYKTIVKEISELK